MVKSYKTIKSKYGKKHQSTDTKRTRRDKSHRICRTGGIVPLIIPQIYADANYDTTRLSSEINSIICFLKGATISLLNPLNKSQGGEIFVVDNKNARCFKSDREATKGAFITKILLKIALINRGSLTKELRFDVNDNNGNKVFERVISYIERADFNRDATVQNDIYNKSFKSPFGALCPHMVYSTIFDYEPNNLGGETYKNYKKTQLLDTIKKHYVSKNKDMYFKNTFDMVLNDPHVSFGVMVMELAENYETMHKVSLEIVRPFIDFAVKYEHIFGRSDIIDLINVPIERFNRSNSAFNSNYQYYLTCALNKSLTDEQLRKKVQQMPVNIKAYVEKSVSVLKPVSVVQTLTKLNVTLKPDNIKKGDVFAILENLPTDVITMPEILTHIGTKYTNDDSARYLMQFLRIYYKCLRKLVILNATVIGELMKMRDLGFVHNDANLGNFLVKINYNDTNKTDRILTERNIMLSDIMIIDFERVYVTKPPEPIYGRDASIGQLIHDMNTKLNPLFANKLGLLNPMEQAEMAWIGEMCSTEGEQVINMCIKSRIQKKQKGGYDDDDDDFDDIVIRKQPTVKPITQRYMHKSKGLILEIPDVSVYMCYNVLRYKTNVTFAS